MMPIWSWWSCQKYMSTSWKSIEPDKNTGLTDGCTTSNLSLSIVNWMYIVQYHNCTDWFFWSTKVYFWKAYFWTVYFWKAYFPKAYFQKVYFLKVYIHEVYFQKVYFLKGYFQKVYFLKNYFPKAYFKSIFLKRIFKSVLCTFQKHICWTQLSKKNIPKVLLYDT